MFSVFSLNLIFNLIYHIIMFSAIEICGITTLKSCFYLNKHKNGYNMIDKCDRNQLELYEEAIQTLNKLQAKSKVLDKTSQNSVVGKTQSKKLQETIKYLNRSGISLDQLDKLSVIHVSGTKGKGSTCALTDSILRSFDLKTGFYSSPHLISVTERIRINGQPITEEQFTKFFWNVYNKLSENKENNNDMPGYFQFLTILSFYVFLKENVNVAIVEVGIGGENDCTNILRNTKTVGITSLGLEHVKLLGDTLDKIAWHKSGIIKEKSNVFTVVQLEECITVLKERAKEKNANLYIVPEFLKYYWKKIPKLQINNKVQPLNASLAIQLSYDWLRNNKPHKFNEYLNNYEDNSMNLYLDSNEYVTEGLEKCFWPGRCQLVKYRNFKIYLDGAHTPESIEICIDWFKESTKLSKYSKLLIYNATGHRDSLILLDMLRTQLKFVKAYFVPNIPYIETTNPDITSFVSNEEEIIRIKSHSELWNRYPNSISEDCFTCILEAFNSISKTYKFEDTVEILVTGSMHLIGDTILAIEAYDKENEALKHINQTV